MGPDPNQRICLLGDITKRKGQKITYKFAQLALVLAKRRVAITWLGTQCPKVDRRVTEVVEWAIAEVRLKACRKDVRLEEDP